MEERILTEVYLKDYSDAVRDEYGLYYSKDYKRLLSYKNPYDKEQGTQHWEKIIINPNTKIICENAFRNCKAYEKYITQRCTGHYQPYGLEIKFENGIKTELILPEGLEIIGKNAFTNSCFYKISLPKSVKTIIGNPFSYSDITIFENHSPYFKLQNGILYTQTKDSLIHCFNHIQTFVSETSTRNIRESAFACQTDLKTVILPNIEEIGYKAFYYCPNLEYVRLTDKLLKIGEKAFKQKLTDLSEEEFEYYHKNGKWKLKSIPLEITIPCNTKYIGKEAFACVTKINNDSTSFVIKDDLLLSADGKVLYNCIESPKTNIIPDTVECIMGSAFEGCQNMERLIIPKSVKYIGNKAFRYCYELKSVYFETNEIELGEYVFSDCINLHIINLPLEIKEIPDGTFDNCPKIDRIIFPNSIVRIGKDAFKDCSFKNLTMPKELITIDEYAFANCRKIQSLNLNDKIQEIRSWAFHGCNEIDELFLPKSILNVGSSTFNIKRKVTISNPLSNIEWNGLGWNYYDVIVQIPTRDIWKMSCYNEIKEYKHIVPLFKEWTLEERLSGEDEGTEKVLRLRMSS